MKKRKIKVGDAEYEVPEDLADALEAEAEAVEETPAETPEPEAVEETPAETPSNDDADALRARVDALEADKKDEPSRIDARVNLVASAREVLGHDVQTTGVSDSALMTQIVLKVRPILKAKLDANKNSHGYLYASYEDALERHREGEANVRDTSTALFQAVVSDDEQTREDADLDQSISNFYLGTVAEGGN